MTNTKVECKPDVPVVPVTITLKDGTVQCTPDCAYVRRGETIEWNCEGDFPFAVHLGYDSPFERVHHQAPRQQRICLDIAKDTRRGRYKYVVAVFDGSNVWIEDPWMIIRD